MRGATVIRALWASYRRPVLVCTVLLTVNLALFLVLTGVIYPHVNQSEREFLQLQEGVRAGQLPGEKLSREALYRLSEQDLEKVFERVPSSEELSALVGELFRLSSAAGLEIDRVQYQPKPEEELGLLSYTLDFDVVGSYRQLKLFVHELEQSDRLVILDSMTLTRSADLSGGVALRLKFTTFFRQEGA